MRFLESGLVVGEESGTVLENSYLGLVDTIDDPVALTTHVYNTAVAKRTKGYENLRMSEIDTACTREWVIGHLSSNRHDVSVRFSNMVIMDQGSAMHWWVQNSPIYFGERRIGYWKCIVCDNRFFGSPPKDPCPGCGAPSKAIFYDEYMFRIEDPYRVVGKFDMILRVGNVYRILEIKTYDGEAVVPRPSDILQVLGYNVFSAYDNRLPIEIDRSVSYLSYIGKKFSWDKPIVTFPIRPTEATVSSIREKAFEFTHGVLTGELPPARNECIGKGFSAGRSKSCPVGDQCSRYFRADSRQYGMGI